jgi:Na+/glutamate symporter
MKPPWLIGMTVLWLTRITGAGLLIVGIGCIIGAWMKLVDTPMIPGFIMSVVGAILLSYSVSADGRYGYLLLGFKK